AASVTLGLPLDHGDDAGLGFDLGAAEDLGAAADLASSTADLAVGPVVCPANVLLCDGFEGGSVSATLWNDGTTQTNASVTVDSTHVHRGQHALHVHTNVVA